MMPEYGFYLVFIYSKFSETVVYDEEVVGIYMYRTTPIRGYHIVRAYVI